MTPLESMERHRDRLLAETPQTSAGWAARAVALDELEHCIAVLKADVLRELQIAQPDPEDWQ